MMFLNHGYCYPVLKFIAGYFCSFKICKATNIDIYNVNVQQILNTPTIYGTTFS
jgi:hypothetical protein